MARTTGITRYECDRCGKAAHLAPGAPEAGDWRDARRYTADGVENARLLCSGCAAAYRKMAEAQDAEFAAFMRREAR